MRLLSYLLAKWCLQREMQSAPKPPAKPDVACLSYATKVHDLWMLRGYTQVLAVPRVAGATSTTTMTALPPFIVVGVRVMRLGYPKKGNAGAEEEDDVDEDHVLDGGTAGAACKVWDVVAAGSGDQASLASVAGRIRDAVRGLDDELVRSTIDYLETTSTMHAACSMPATSPVPHSLPLSHPAKHAKHAHRIHRPSKQSRRPSTVSLPGATPRRQQPMAMASGAPPARWWGSDSAPYVVPADGDQEVPRPLRRRLAITDANGAVVLKVKVPSSRSEPHHPRSPGCPSSPCKKRSFYY
ncbi:hypothetical protein ZWY2020_022161 [Hordeum vulgare]|nr:hypothetical protein ZWY2020_022161 [Hordeum vulgare]